MAGYHLNIIPKGTYGEASKITEEYAEFVDAWGQGNSVMVLNELADLIGAIEGYLDNAFVTITLNDLIVMKDATKRAFESGHRS